jgi:hypothetical protein
MHRRALIVCPDYDLLPGFSPSALCMTQLLGGRGFDVETCCGPQATRAGILNAYRALIRAARPRDAVVVYYVGHSGRTVNATYEPDRGMPRALRNICPSDYARTTADDFRGISSFELSHLLARLTARTVNVTVILESCFTTAMMRAPDPPQVRPIKPTLNFHGLRRHLSDLRTEYGELPFPAGNPHAIRISAAGSQSKAYQIQLPATDDARRSGFELEPGSWIGSMTWTLARTLSRIGEARVSWHAINAMLRSDMVIQRPEIEGPTARVPFSLAEVEPARYSVRSDRGTAIIDAGQLLGLSPGDVYGVTSPATDEPFEELTIDQVSIREARARRPAWRPGSRELPVDAVAVPISTARREPVRVLGDRLDAQEIEAALVRSSSVRPAAPGDRDPLAEVRVRGDAIALHDELGAVVSVYPYPDRLASAVSDLENLATERRLRALPEHTATDLAGVTVELILFDGDRRRSLPAHGATLGLRDRITVQVVNRTAGLVWAHVFNIGLRRQITQLQTSPSGKPLQPGAAWDLGEQPDGAVSRFDLCWPDGVPRDRPRLDTLMVVLASQPWDLGALVTRSSTPRTAALHARLRRPAATRGPSREDGEEGFAIRWLDYWLAPVDASLDFGGPHLEGAPHDPFARATPPVRSTLAIELHALAPGRRVDVLVCEPGGMGLRTATLVAPSRGELEIWTGELAAPAEVFVWISALGARASLAQLLETPELRGLAAALASSSARAEVPSFQLAAVARAALRTIDPGVETAFRSSFEPGNEQPQRYDASTAAFSLRLAPSAPGQRRTVTGSPTRRKPSERTRA